MKLARKTALEIWLFAEMSWVFLFEALAIFSINARGRLVSDYNALLLEIEKESVYASRRKEELKNLLANINDRRDLKAAVYELEILIELKQIEEVVRVNRIAQELADKAMVGLMVRLSATTPIAPRLVMVVMAFARTALE